ncbi:MAG: hypothetical protein WB493_19060, partial [Anaeromyxobacteraceae bacterium]
MNLRPAAALALLVAFTPALAATPAAAAEVRPTAVDVASISDLTGIAISPDGARVAWSVRQKSFDPEAKAPPGFDPAKASEADLKAGWKVTTQLWVAPADGGEARQLTWATEA